jgi:hypothetical protein
MKIGVSGSRDGLTEHQSQFWSRYVQSQGSDFEEFHHGDCKGVDSQTHDLVREHLPETKIVVHPPSVDAARAYKSGDTTKTPKSYLARNKKIVQAVDQLFAFPASGIEVLRSGTWATIRHAKKTGVKTTIVGPKGCVQNYNY